MQQLKKVEGVRWKMMMTMMKMRMRREYPLLMWFPAYEILSAM